MNKPSEDGAERRVDRVSQRLLLALSDGPETAPRLRDEIGVEQTQQVHYRVSQHLSDWVEVVGSEERPGATKDAKVYGLTPAGEEVVEEHRSEWEEPATLDETRETAREALRAAESAKKKSDTARKNVHRYRDRVQELEEKVEKLPSESAISTRLAGTATSAAERIERREPWSDDVGDLDERLGELEREIERLSAEVPRETDVDDVKHGQQVLQSGLEEVRDGVTAIESDVERFREVTQGGVLRRLKWILTGR